MPQEPIKPDLTLDQIKEMQTSVLRTLGYIFNSTTRTYTHQPVPNYSFMIREMGIFQFDGQIRQTQSGDKLYETTGFSALDIASELYDTFIKSQVSNYYKYVNENYSKEAK